MRLDDFVKFLPETDVAENGGMQAIQGDLNLHQLNLFLLGPHGSFNAILPVDYEFKARRNYSQHHARCKLYSPSGLFVAPRWSTGVSHGDVSRTATVANNEKGPSLPIGRMVGLAARPRTTAAEDQRMPYKADDDKASMGESGVGHLGVVCPSRPVMRTAYSQYQMRR